MASKKSRKDREDGSDGSSEDLLDPSLLDENEGTDDGAETDPFTPEETLQEEGGAEDEDAADTDATDDDGADAEEGDADPDLISYFQTYLDDEGALPEGADQFFAQVPDRETASAREAGYAAVPRERTPDYMPLVQRMAPVETPEEEMSFTDRLQNAAQIGLNNGIRALNDLTGSNYEEFKVVRSEEDEGLSMILTEMAAPMALAGGLAVGTTMGLPALAAGALALTYTGVKGIAAAYDNPEVIDAKYEAFIFDLLGEGGVIPSDPRQLSKLDLTLRLWLAETIDTITAGGVLKAGSKALPMAGKLAGTVAESGADYLRRLGNKGQVDLRALGNRTPEELAEAKAVIDGNLDAYLARKVSSPGTQEALRQLRIARESMAYDPSIIEGMKARRVELNRSARSLIDDFDTETALKGDRLTHDAWERYKSSGGSERSLKDFIRGMDQSFKDMTVGEIPPVRQVQLKTDSVTALLKGRKRFADRLLDNAGKTEDTARIDSLLYTAKEYTDLKTLAELHRVGPKFRAHARLSGVLDSLTRWEGDLMRYKRMGADGVLTPVQKETMERLQKEYDTTVASLMDPKGKAVETLTAFALQVRYDNILAKGALSTAATASAGSVLNNAIFRKGFMPVYDKAKRLLGHEVNSVRYGSVTKRMWNNVRDKYKNIARTKKGREELWDVATGKRMPRRYDFTKEGRGFVPDIPGGRAIGLATGTSRTMLHLVDEFIGSAADALSEVTAMEKMIRSRAHDPKKLKEFLDDLDTMAPSKIIEKYPEYVGHYINGIRHETGKALFTARPKDFEDMGYMGQLSRKIYDVVTEWGHHNASNTRHVFAHAVAPFARTWANALMASDEWTALGAIRRRGVGQALADPKRVYGTGVIGLGSLFLESMGWIDIIDAASDEKELRKVGGESGVIIGGHAFKWDALGTAGTALKNLYKAMEIVQLTPVTGDLLAGAGVTDETAGSEDPSMTRLTTAMVKTIQMFADDSFFHRSLSTFMFAALTGDGEGLARYGRDVFASGVNPAQGALGRFAGGATSPDETSLVPLAGSLGIISELADAVRGMDPVDTRRDAFGVPWTKGETDGDETTWLGDLTGYSLFAFNPGRRGKTPKSDEVRKFLLANSALKAGSVVAGGKVISQDTFREAFGFEPPKLTRINRHVTYDGIRYSLPARAANDKRTLVSMDWKAMERVLDRYEVHWDTKDSLPGLENEDRLWSDRIGIMKTLMTWGSMRDTVRMFYRGATEDTRTIDVIHHLAVADIADYGGLRTAARDEIRAFTLMAAEHRRVKAGLRGLTDEEIKIMAENITRMKFINRFYNWMESFADDVMEASPAVDELRTEDHTTEG